MHKMAAILHLTMMPSVSYQPRLHVASSHVMKKIQSILLNDFMLVTSAECM
jgi:hypothetical protein